MERHDRGGRRAASTDLATGDRVVCEGMIPCNRCRRCKAGDTQLCENYDQLGFTRGGGYGEYVLVPRHVVHRLPDARLVRGRRARRAGSCVLRGLERGRAPAGRDGRRDRHRHARVAGGHARAAVRRPARWSRTAIRPEELGFAERLGADADRARRRARTPSRRRTACSAADSTSCSRPPALSAAVELATRLVRPGGRVVLLGIAGEGKVLELPADRIMFGDMEVIGSCSYPTSAWSHVVRLLEHGPRRLRAARDAPLSCRAASRRRSR